MESIQLTRMPITESADTQSTRKPVLHQNQSQAACMLMSTARESTIKTRWMKLTTTSGHGPFVAERQAQILADLAKNVLARRERHYHQDLSPDSKCSKRLATLNWASPHPNQDPVPLAAVATRPSCRHGCWNSEDQCIRKPNQRPIVAAASK